MKVLSANHFLMVGVDFFTKHTKIQDGLNLKINAKNTMLAILLLGLLKITANIRIYVTSETNVCKHLKMKGIPQEKMKEIIDYFFKNKNNTAGDIANKFGLKLWQAD